MLRISVKDKPNGLHLKLEGKLIPPWTSELEAVWHQVVNSLDGKRLHIDLCGTTFVDGQGMHLLRAIVKAANPEIETNSPLTRQFAEQARSKAQA
jgi:anti-anti-sigma regulatory factor